MKKLYILFAVMIMVGMVATIVALPGRNHASSLLSSAGVGQTLPDSVMKIVKVACMDCHGTGGSAMASSRVNFSKWDSYTPEKMASKATGICKEVSAGSMPPKRYLQNNPKAVLTKEQQEVICNWAGSLNK